MSAHMSPLTLQLIATPPHRLDMSALRPELLQGKSASEISKITLSMGQQWVELGQFFAISGTDTQHIIVRDSCSMLDFLGHDMQAGKLEIEGDVGHYLGLNMQAEIVLHGSAGNFAASQMRGGLLHIHGNVGDYAGGALIGNRHGMRGGMLVINGKAGDRLADQMRRGTILLDGDAGDYCAANMLAGTLAIAGKVGAYCGYAMRRGSIILQQPASLHSTWVNHGSHQLAFLALLFKSWQPLPSAWAQVKTMRAQRFSGDLANAGNGEILLLDAGLDARR